MIAPAAPPDPVRPRHPRDARVRARAEFDRVFADGRRVATPLLALHLLMDAAPPRLGLAVSRKVDPRAVGRNRIKRQLRERFRHLRAQLAPGAYVFVARPPARRATNAELLAAMEDLLRRARALPAPDAAGTMAAPGRPDRPADSRPPHSPARRPPAR